VRVPSGADASAGAPSAGAPSAVASVPSALFFFRRRLRLRFGLSPPSPPSGVAPASTPSVSSPSWASSSDSASSPSAEAAAGGAGDAALSLSVDVEGSLLCSGAAVSTETLPIGAEGSRGSVESSREICSDTMEEARAWEGVPYIAPPVGCQPAGRTATPKDETGTLLKPGRWRLSGLNPERNDVSARWAIACSCRRYGRCSGRRARPGRRYA
jgi:hypothetical protein